MWSPGEKKESQATLSMPKIVESYQMEQAKLAALSHLPEQNLIVEVPAVGCSGGQGQQLAGLSTLLLGGNGFHTVSGIDATQSPSKAMDKMVNDTEAQQQHPSNAVVLATSYANSPVNIDTSGPKVYLTGRANDAA